MVIYATLKHKVEHSSLLTPHSSLLKESFESRIMKERKPLFLLHDQWREIIHYHRLLLLTLDLPILPPLTTLVTTITKVHLHILVSTEKDKFKTGHLGGAMLLVLIGCWLVPLRVNRPECQCV